MKSISTFLIRFALGALIGNVTLWLAPEAWLIVILVLPIAVAVASRTGPPEPTWRRR